MPRNFLRTAVLAMALASPALASPPITGSEVLDAIRTFDANASGSVTVTARPGDPNVLVTEASNIILRYVLESDDVVVDLGTDSVTWCDVTKGLSDLPHSGERGLLLAAYLAGSVKAQLESGRQNASPYPGWVAMLKIYRSVKIREGISIPEVETLLARQMDGTLESYAGAAMKRSADSLRRKYGAAAGQAKPAVTASAQP
jgi:hypothetical protein